MFSQLQHEEKTRRVQEEMRGFFAKEEKVKIYHGSTTSSRAQTFEKNKYVNVSDFDEIIEINTQENYVVVEPNVPMDALVRATKHYGLAPAVVMELPGITVGGGIQGGAGESSSFKYGLFHETALEYEIVLGNGEVLRTSRSSYPDIFHGTACSYGSLGIITLVKLKLVPVKPHVHLTYKHVDSYEEAVRVVTENTRQSFEFVDAIMFSKDRGVVMLGDFSDGADLPRTSFSKADDEWFYIHADNISQKNASYQEIIPLEDYYFRYDRGGFWMGRYIFKFYKVPFLRPLRYLLNSILTTRMIIRLSHGTNLLQQYFVQDLSLPRENTVKLLSFIEDKLKIYPLWLCPLRPTKEEKLSPSYLYTDLVINVGVWGEGAKKYESFVAQNRDSEKVVSELGGRKVLYAHAYYTREEFWNIYDEGWYSGLRKKYHAEQVFPDIFDKTRVKEKYKPKVIVGLLRGLLFKRIPIN